MFFLYLAKQHQALVFPELFCHYSKRIHGMQGHLRIYLYISRHLGEKKLSPCRAGQDESMFRPPLVHFPLVILIPRLGGVCKAESRRGIAGGFDGFLL